MKKLLIVVEEGIRAKLSHNDNNQMYILSVNPGKLDSIRVYSIDGESEVEIKEEQELDKSF